MNVFAWIGAACAVLACLGLAALGIALCFGAAANARRERRSNVERDLRMRLGSWLSEDEQLSLFFADDLRANVLMRAVAAEIKDNGWCTVGAVWLRWNQMLNELGAPPQQAAGWDANGSPVEGDGAA